MIVLTDSLAVFAADVDAALVLCAWKILCQFLLSPGLFSATWQWYECSPACMVSVAY